MTSDAASIRPERICAELTDWLPENGILVSDTGHSGMWTAGMIDLSHPSQSYLRAAGSLGWGLPAAIGAQLACPERPVVLFSGDSGFYYHLVKTSAHLGIADGSSGWQGFGRLYQDQDQKGKRGVWPCFCARRRHGAVPMTF